MASIIVDLKLILITLAAFVVRFYNLEHPRAVVFDELHYIKFITLYAKRIFFFDSQPPFGKQLLALFAHIIGFQGDLSYNQIGEPYKPDVPILTLRLLPCVLGTLIAPICYLISLELGLCQLAATLVGTLIVIENSLIISSRLIILDSILIFFSVACLLCYLKFHKNLSIIWLTAASCCATLAICTKYSGLYTYATFVVLVCYTWWNLLDRIEVDVWLKRAVIYIACIVIAPVAIYLTIYYAHLSWLIKAGPHDSIMTSAFQASLENGLASIIRGQPLEIVHGSQVTIRHTHGRSCWLHSHDHLYPIKYADGRGSSHQQQVTCYSFKDVNNWWIVKRPHLDELVVTEPHDKIKDGDLIQLVHGLTGRTLNSHDVASAMSPFSQEVSCYVDHNISMPAQNVWQIKLSNPKETNYHWHTINSKIQLIHYNSSLALRFSGRQLPDWGFHQHEVVADREIKNQDTIWNVEEHRYTKSEDQREREIQLGQAEFVPLEPSSLSFFEKFWELHFKIINYQQEAVKDHLYASEMPLDWLFMSMGTAYWVDNQSTTGNAQIFFMANVFTNYTALLCICAYSLIWACYLLMRRRQLKLSISEELWVKVQFTMMVLMSGYLINYLPYFVYESPLFLHYYLNAYMYKIFFIGAIVQHIYDFSNNPYLASCVAVFVLSRSIYGFSKLAPLTYGTDLTLDELESLRWSKTWQLIVLNP
jgi:dolichyl-phosphate-mannose-protein mannosyltransferase